MGSKRKNSTGLARDIQNLRILLDDLEKTDSRRRKAEKVLKERERQFEEAQAIAHMGSWEWDIQNNRSTWSKEIYRILGLNPREISAPSYDIFLSVVHPEDKEDLVRAIASIPKNLPYSSDYRIICKDGKIKYLNSMAEVVYRKGKPVLMRGTTQDITERKIVEEELARRDRQQKAILDNIPDIAWLKDKESRFIAVNGPFARSCGYAPEDLVGKTDLDIWPRHLAEAYRADDREVMRTGRRKQVEEPLADKTGQSQWIETIKTPIYNGKGEVIGTTGIARDITERKKADEELERYRKHLQEMVEKRTAELRATYEEKEKLESIAGAVETMNSIGYVFSGIRHEIGNPINSMKAALRMLRVNMEKFSPDSRNTYLDRALSELGKIEYLLKSLKNYNMYEKLEMQPVNIRSFMEEFNSLVRRDLGKMGIKVSSGLEDAGYATADPRALQQVLLNIVANAADAVAGRPEPKIRLSVHRNGDEVRIRVEDNGPGMSEAQQKGLFKPFYTTKPSGTGLGLVIVKKMLLKMNGGIEISSREGEGTKVDILVPASPN